jgi:hypothetical protein
MVVVGVGSLLGVEWDEMVVGGVFVRWFFWYL